MLYLIICAAAFFASGLTLFSGFGLGTILVPVFALFFPVQVAVGMTAVVHFLNNIFKIVLVGRHADRKVVLQFGLPALAASFLGAWQLARVSHFEALFTYEILGWTLEVVPVKLIIGGLMILFALMEAIPLLERLSIRNLNITTAALLSGYFGGLSGHQGAFRSTFLVNRGLSKEAFIGTNALIACLVDLARLVVYGALFQTAYLKAHQAILIPATLCAFLGAWTGNRLVKKATIGAIRICVTVLLILIGFGLITGLV